MPGRRAPQCPRHSGGSAPPPPSPPCCTACSRPAPLLPHGRHRPDPSPGGAPHPMQAASRSPSPGRQSRERRPAPPSRGALLVICTSDLFQPEVAAQTHVHSPPGPGGGTPGSLLLPTLPARRPAGSDRNRHCPRAAGTSPAWGSTPGGLEGGQLQGPAWTLQTAVPRPPVQQPRANPPLRCTAKGTLSHWDLTV